MEFDLNGYHSIAFWKLYKMGFESDWIGRSVWPEFKELLAFFNEILTSRFSLI